MTSCGCVTEFGKRVFAIHKYHKHGHLEKVYENALAHRLRKLGLDVKQQYPLKVYDEDGTVIGEHLADLIVENRLIIELSRFEAIPGRNTCQSVPSYLSAFSRFFAAKFFGGLKV
jgi:GxxExxY protein